MTYLDDLARELGRVGITGRLRRRILSETEDHLRSDPGAVDRFGAPRVVANAFAAELGTRWSRRAAVAAFAALGLAGAVFSVSFVGLARAGTAPGEPFPAAVASLLIILAPQVAFVAGTLAAVRTLRRRNDAVLPAAERTVIGRRTAVGLLAGIATTASLAVLAFEYRGQLAGWRVTFTLVAAPAATAILVLAAIPAVRALRLRPETPGPAGDVFDDLGLQRYRGRPWWFARRVALMVGLAVWVAAAAQGDPFDGLAQGVFEAIACLGGFAVLGRFLGLRA